MYILISKEAKRENVNCVDGDFCCLKLLQYTCQLFQRDIIEEAIKPENREQDIPAKKDPLVPSWPYHLWAKLFILGERCIGKRKNRPDVTKVYMVPYISKSLYMVS